MKSKRLKSRGLMTDWEREEMKAAGGYEAYCKLIDQRAEANKLAREERHKAWLESPNYKAYRENLERLLERERTDNENINKEGK